MPLSANMLRGDGQIDHLESHTGRCGWTKEVGRERSDVARAPETTVTRCDSTENKDMLTTPHQHWVLLATEPWPSQENSESSRSTQTGASCCQPCLGAPGSWCSGSRDGGRALQLIRTIVAQPNHPTRPTPLPCMGTPSPLQADTP